MRHRYYAGHLLIYFLNQCSLFSSFAYTHSVSRPYSRLIGLRDPAVWPTYCEDDNRNYHFPSDYWMIFWLLLHILSYLLGVVNLIVYMVIAAALLLCWFWQIWLNGTLWIHRHLRFDYFSTRCLLHLNFSWPVLCDDVMSILETVQHLGFKPILLLKKWADKTEPTKHVDKFE